MGKITRDAFIDAFGTTGYIIMVASFMYYLQDSAPRADIVIVPIAMLMLFVFSAALTGFLVFGKPVMFYIDGKKKEAVRLVGYTLGILLILTLLAFLLIGVYFSLVA